MRIVFDAHFGDDIRKVEISQRDYTHGDHWHIYINDIEVAAIFHRPDGYHYNDNSLNAEDAQAALDRIMEYLGEPYQQLVFYCFAPKPTSFKKAIAPLIS